MEDPIRVVCRVRPANAIESLITTKKYLRVENGSEIIVESKPEAKQFTFDYVADDTVCQYEFFENVGLSITETCLQGFNGTILCYGQTGTGKSHTIFGSTEDLAANDSRGLVPRALDYIFKSFCTMKEECSSSNFQSKCSFFEIYQEKVFDLLDNSATNIYGLQVREDSKTGVFVDGIIEETVATSEDASRLLEVGYKNRRVGETAMNRESSRSHAIFTLTLNMSFEQESGSIVQKRSKFCLVDLAGSERQRETHSSGERLKEAGSINKSLSTLGNVINSLSLKSSGGAHKRHINYRDSKLTFLLRDSLGGNTKTVLIATLSPSVGSIDETLSTLKFAHRAKSISNIVAMNQETTGSVIALQKEIEGLKATIQHMSTVNKSEVHSAAVESCFVDVNNINSERCRVDRLVVESLSQALSKSEALELEILRQQSTCAAFAAQLEQSERVVLGLEMKVKMRDSEIQRLKRVGTGTMSTSGCTDESSNETNLLLQAGLSNAAVVRDKLQFELLRYRQAVEEIRRRLIVEGGLDPISQDADRIQIDQNLTVKNIFKKLWGQNEETLHSTGLSELFEDLNQRYIRLEYQFESLRENSLLTNTNISREDEQVNVEKLQQITVALEESQIRESLLIKQMQLLQDKLNESQEEISRLCTSNEHEALRASSRIEELTATVNSLNEKLAEKEFSIAQQDEFSKQSESAIIIGLREKEADARSLYLRSMKDNAVLIRSFKEMENKLQSEINLRTAQDQEICTLRNNLEQSIIDLSTMEGNYKYVVQQLSDIREETSLLNDTTVELRKQIVDLEEKLETSRTEITQLSADHALACFDRDSSQEDNEHNLILIETLRAERTEIVETLSRHENKYLAQAKEVEELRCNIVLLENNIVALRASNKESDECSIMKIESLISSEKLLLEQKLQLEDALDHVQKLNKSTIEELSALKMMHQETERVAAERTKTLVDKITELTENCDYLSGGMQSLLLEKDSLESTVCNLQNQINVKDIELISTRSQVVEVSADKLKVEGRLAALEVSFSGHQIAAQVTLNELQAAMLTLRNENEELKRKADDSHNLVTRNRVLEEELVRARQQILDTQEENNRLCGHHNSKQKIQQHMQLKKELMEQAQMIKQLREQIVAMSMEKDSASSAQDASVTDTLPTTNLQVAGSGMKGKGVAKSSAGVAGTTKDLVTTYSRKYLDLGAPRSVPLSTLRDTNANLARSEIERESI